MRGGAREGVESRRKSGRIEIDNRVYLFKPLIEGVMSEKDKLKRVVVAYPSGNTTAVVFDQLLAADRKQLNTQVMENWKKGYSQFPEVEQCCFVTKPVNKEALARVELFGGEFCANATRSVIWMLTGGRDYYGTIEVSGVDRLLEFKVENSIVTLEMPLPEEQSVKEVAEGMLVQLDGIAQLVVTGTEARTPKQLLSELKAGNRYCLAEQPAFGVSYYESATGNARFNVWVKAVDTDFDETACGSGTCAIGVALAAKRRESVTVNVVQPSGEVIAVTAVWDEQKGKVVRAEISGQVNILYDGPLSLS